MKARYCLPLLFTAALIGCSDDSSNSAAPESSSSVEESSSSVSEFAPIIFEKLDKSQMIAGESFKLGLTGNILIDEENSEVEDASDSKIDSVIVKVKNLDTKKAALSLNVKADYPATNIGLNSAEIMFDDLDGCGKFRAYIWAYASGTSKEVYSAVDSLDFEKAESLCKEVEEPESSSSKEEVTECTPMEKGGSVVVSTMGDGEGRFVNFATGKVSTAEDDMQAMLVIDEFEAPYLKTIASDIEIGEDSGNFRAGIVPEEVCLEKVAMYEDTRGNEVELAANAWFVLEEGETTYLILAGKIVDGESGSSVELTYWTK